MTTPVDVLVAIPAHDEAESIAACLTSVVDALRAAREAGAIRRAWVAVAAHRCRDDTADRARAVLESADVESLVWPLDDEALVGAVRTRLIHRAAAAPPPLDDRGWVLSTDADTVVPVHWVSALLAVARDADADLVLGLAELDSWHADETAQRTYRALIESGITGDQHRHAYAANLAVRWSTFCAVGGFPRFGTARSMLWPRGSGRSEVG